MKMRRKFFLVAALVVAAALVFAVPAFAQGDVPAEPPFDEVAFLASVVLMTGFLKQQFNLPGKWVLVAGLGVTLFLGFLPELKEMLPAGQKIVDLILLWVKSAGLFDTVVNVGAKIATATAINKTKLSTDGSDILPAKV